MKKTLLTGGRLLCMAMAFAGVVSLASCKDDDEPKKKEEPAPVPVDPTPAPVVIPDTFMLNSNLWSLNDTVIKANTLLVDGSNSGDSLTVSVKFGNQGASEIASLKLNNAYLGTVDVDVNNSSAVKFLAIEGDYTLKLNNGTTKTFSVKGASKELSKSGRSLSNMYNVEFNSSVNTFLGITFEPYNDSEGNLARLSGTGKFIKITEDDYNSFLTSTSLSTLTDFIEDATPVERLVLKDVKQFIYINNGMNFVFNITSFAGADVQTSDLTMTVTY